MKMTMYPRSNHPAPFRTAVLLLGLFLIGILPAGAAAQDTAIEPAVTLVNWLVINQPGTYILDHDLSGVTYGVAIASSDVVLDGTGHAITGAVADGSAGILVTGPSFTPVTNVTVRNVVVQHWDDGIHIAEAIDTTLAHAIAEETSSGYASTPAGTVTGITGSSTRPSARTPAAACRSPTRRRASRSNGARSPATAWGSTPTRSARPTRSRTTSLSARSAGTPETGLPAATARSR